MPDETPAAKRVERPASIKVALTGADGRMAWSESQDGVVTFYGADPDSLIAAVQSDPEMLTRTLRAALVCLQQAAEEWEYGVRNNSTGRVGFPWSRPHALATQNDSGPTLPDGRPYMEAVRHHPASPWEPVPTAPEEAGE